MLAPTPILNAPSIVERAGLLLIVMTLDDLHPTSLLKTLIEEFGRSRIRVPIVLEDRTPYLLGPGFTLARAVNPGTFRRVLEMHNFCGAHLERTTWTVVENLYVVLVFH